MNDQGTERDQQVVPTETPSAYVPPVTLPQPEITTSPQIPTPIRDNKTRLLLLVIGAVVVVLVAVSLLWYFVLRNQDSSTDSVEDGADTTSEQTDKAVTFDQPDRLIYYRGNGYSTPQTLYSRSIASGDEMQAMTLPPNTSIESTAIRDDQVAISVTSGGDDSINEVAIYYSGDSGRSYKKIYSVSDTTKEKGEMGTQITSLVFSTDGKALVAGVLHSIAVKDGDRTTGISHKNEVTEILLEEKNPTKILFTSTAPGILLKGYDRSKQKVIYLASGCYNCEPLFSDIYSYDIVAAAQDTLYHSKPLTGSIEVDKQFAKVLVLNSEDPQADSGSPYSLLTVDIATKAKVTLTAPDDERIRQAGYTPEGSPYFATNTKVQELTNGKLTTLIEFTGDSNDAFSIPWILFAGDKGVVANAVTSIEDDKHETAKFSVLFSEKGDTKATEIIKNGSINGEITLIGVTRR